MRIDTIVLDIQRKDGSEERRLSPASVAGARFCARDTNATRRALDEMIAHDGRYSAATLTNPSIFRIAGYLLTQSDSFEVQGALTGGECEVVAIRNGKEILISVGSDQCDRELDPLFPDKPKQMCPHPMAGTAWLYEEVRDHWDSLRVHSEVFCNDQSVVLQDSPLSELVDLEYLLSMEAVRSLPDPMFLFCGSAEFLKSAPKEVERLGLPEMTCHGVGESFLVRLTDPVLERTIEHRFSPIPLGDDYHERKDRGTAGTPHH